MCFADILHLLVSGVLQQQIAWLDTGLFVNNQRVSLVVVMTILVSDASEDFTREEEVLPCVVISRKDHLFTLNP